MTRHKQSPPNDGPSESKVCSYTNRMGATYYLHQGETKTGKTRYFVAKTIRDGALGTMPGGYELSESINGVVSVRKVSTTTPRIPDADLAIVRAELGRHRHLQRHRAELVKGEIVVFEPMGGMSPTEMARLARVIPMARGLLGAQLHDTNAQSKYEPVMKFLPDDRPGHYQVHRMTYRGQGGWSWPLDGDALQKLVKKYLKVLGTEDFYELM